MEQNYHLTREAQIFDFTGLEEDANDEVQIVNESQEQFLGMESPIPAQHEVQLVNANSIVDQLESRLAVGEVMKNEEDAYLLYFSYAHAKGFSVKKGHQCYFPRSNELQAKEFQCSRERRSSGSLYKTGCKARLRIGRREKDGEWKVTRFVKEHNHEMVDQTLLLKSSCLKMRWMRSINKIISDKDHKDGHIFEMIFVYQMMSSAYILCTRCKAHEEARNLLTEVIDSASMQVDALFENLSLNDQGACVDLVGDKDNEITDEVPMHNPLHVKSRGITNAPIVRRWDDKNEKGKQIGKESSSEFSINVSQQMNYVPPPQYPVNHPLQLPPFVSQFGANKSQGKYPSHQGGNENSHIGGQ